jgi:hypothetical protein
VYAIDSATGESVRDFPTGSSYFVSHFDLSLDGITLFAGGYNGKLHALTTGKQEISSVGI